MIEQQLKTSIKAEPTSQADTRALNSYDKLVLPSAKGTVSPLDKGPNIEHRLVEQAPSRDAAPTPDATLTKLAAEVKRAPAKGKESTVEELLKTVTAETER